MARRSKRAKKAAKRNRKRQHVDHQPKEPDKASLKVESLEPRILLSATWVGTDGDDVFDGTDDADEACGLAGNDELHGGRQNDLLFGGEGDDVLYGEEHQDTLDGGAGDDQLFGGGQADTLIGGGGNDYMDGGKQDDAFRFDGAQDGDVITVVGGHGNDTIDLSAYTDDQISDDGSTITVDLGDGQSFTINYTEVENVLTGGPPNTAPTATDGSVTVPEDTAATINLSGSDPDSGDAVEQYRIESLPEGGTLLLDGEAVNPGDTVSQAQIDAGRLTFQPEADWNGSTEFSFSAYDGEAWSDGPGGSRSVERQALTHLGGGDIAVDPLTGQADQPYFELTIDLEEADAAFLRHGMTGRVRLPGRTEPVGFGLVRSLIRFANSLMQS